MKYLHVSPYAITIEIPQWWRDRRAEWQRLVRRFQKPCTARHPRYDTPCGNWPYAERYRLYRQGHKEEHCTMVPLNPGCTVSTHW